MGDKYFVPLRPIYKKDTMPGAVIIKKLSIGYGNKVVASNLNAELLSGELTCLYGVNGVGKSTLIRSLAKKYKDDCAIVLTDKPDISNMKVKELVGLGRSPYTGFFGLLSETDKQIVTESLDMVGISTLAERNYTELSDGEKQKVMIAQALSQQRAIIFLDEPTAYLDYPSKMEVLKLLSEIAKKENKAILMSTHDFELSLRYCHRVWIMDEEVGLVSVIPSEVLFDEEKGKFVVKS